MEKKFTVTIDYQCIMNLLAEDSPGAIAVLIKVLSRPLGIQNISILYHFNITGDKIYLLWNDCCERNFDKFDRTLLLLQSGVYTEEEIHRNLQLEYAVPFLDDSLVIDGIPNYGDDFSKEHRMWDTYVTKQYDFVKPKIMEAINGQKIYQKK